MIKNEAYIKQYSERNKQATKRTGSLFFANTDAKLNNANALNKELEALLKKDTADPKDLSEVIGKYRKSDKDTKGALSIKSSSKVDAMLTAAEKELEVLPKDQTASHTEPPAPPVPPVAPTAQLRSSSH